jgi:hypothetical protein
MITIVCFLFFGSKSIFLEKYAKTRTKGGKKEGVAGVWKSVGFLMTLVPLLGKVHKNAYKRR